jgi:hypothetical protein
MDKAQRLGRKEEERTARLHGGRATPASGSGQTVKNDVRNTEWSFEVKSTSQQGYRLSRDALTVAEKNALADGRRMAFVISFLRNPGMKNGNRYVLMTEDDFLEREHRLEQLEIWLEIYRTDSLKGI